MTDAQRDAMREAFYSLMWAAQDLAIAGPAGWAQRPLPAARRLAVLLDGEFGHAPDHPASYVYALDSYERRHDGRDGAEDAPPPRRLVADAPEQATYRPAGVPLSALIVAADLVRPELVDLR